MYKFLLIFLTLRNEERFFFFYWFVKNSICQWSSPRRERSFPLSTFGFSPWPEECYFPVFSCSQKKTQVWWYTLRGYSQAVALLRDQTSNELQPVGWRPQEHTCAHAPFFWIHLLNLKYIHAVGLLLCWIVCRSFYSFGNSMEKQTMKKSGSPMLYLPALHPLESPATELWADSGFHLGNTCSNFWPRTSRLQKMHPG